MRTSSPAPLNTSAAGFALATAMMLLALLSLLTAASLQCTTLEVLISAADRDARQARYLAKAALEEARHYALCGWGKLENRGQGQVELASSPPPAAVISWDDNRFRNFTLVDNTGSGYAIASHTGDASPTITIISESSTPEPGCFTIIKEIATARWEGAKLVIQDAAWATIALPDLWRGWLLCDAEAYCTKVLASGSDSAQEVWLETSEDPGPAPYTLCINPWLTALAASVVVQGDHDSSPETNWERSFNTYGVASVWAQEQACDGRGACFKLYASASAEESEQALSLHIVNPGMPDQASCDLRFE